MRESQRMKSHDFLPLLRPVLCQDRLESLPTCSVRRILNSSAWLLNHNSSSFCTKTQPENNSHYKRCGRFRSIWVFRIQLRRKIRRNSSSFGRRRCFRLPGYRWIIEWETNTMASSFPIYMFDMRYVENQNIQTHKRFRTTKNNNEKIHSCAGCLNLKINRKSVSFACMQWWSPHKHTTQLA